MRAFKSVCIGAVAAPLHKVNPGRSTVGNYTYSHARNFGVNHGHNAIYYTSAQRTSAGKFTNSKVGLPYNDKFYSNRLVNASSYNCSQLVWVSWRSAANIDLSGHNRTGIHPGDLRNSPISSFVKNMPRV